LKFATLTEPAAVLFAIGVNIAVQLAPESEKLLSVPPLTAISDNTKSVAASLRVKMMSAVSPALSAVLFELIAMVGGVVSMAIEHSLLFV
jgi:hypothetical protein